MARPDKEAKVKELSEQFSSADAAVLTEYRGLSVQALQNLRRSLGSDTNYTIAKNTLTAIAARQANIEGLEEQLTGPTAIAFITGDVAAAAKGIRNFAREHPALVIKGGYMDGKVLDATTVRVLADLESREVLLSKMAGAMNANLAKAVYLFAAPLSQAARAVAALKEAAESNPALISETGPAPAAATPEEAPASTPAAEAAEETPAEAAAE